MILGFDQYKVQAIALADALDMPFSTIELHRFPDGESKIKLPVPLPETIIICQTLHQPNDKLIELMLTCQTARTHGVKRIILVAPYLCYMRQDIAFQPGEAVSQTLVGNFIGSLVDDVITVDPHLHRISHLGEAIPLKSAYSLTGAELMGQFLQSQLSDAILIGPDEESEQWVSQVAIPCGFEFVVGHKIRHGDKDVEVELPAFSYVDRSIVLVDDVISSGYTMAKAAKALKQKGCGKIHAICTHALLAPGAEALFNEHGIETLWSTDSIPHASNIIPLAPLLADSIKAIW